jgi:hypothetical protein
MALNQGSRMDGITRVPSFRQKLGDNVRRMRRCIVAQKTPGPTFLKLRPKATNLSDHSLIYKIYRLQSDIPVQIRDEWQF